MLYTKSFLLPILSRILSLSLTYLCPPFSPVNPYSSPPHLPPGSLASWIFSHSTARAVPSLPHPPDQVSVKYMPPCRWCHGGEGCWTTLLLVTS